MSELKVEIEGGKTFSIENLKENFAILDGTEVNWDSLKLKENKFHLIKNNKSFTVEVVNADSNSKTFNLKVNNSLYTAKVEDRFDLLLHKLGMDIVGSSALSELKAPMPGLVLKIAVEVGQKVSTGENLVVLEAMKMENVLKATGDVTIKSVNVKEGVAVEKNQVLIEFE